jgi:hypothetical protein
MLSLIVVSAVSSALVAAAMTFWLVSRRRTLQVQQLDIVDSEGRVRGRLSAFDGSVGLALGDGTDRTRVGMFVNKAGEPGITLFDDRGTARFSLEIVEVPEEIELSREQLKTMSPQEIGQVHGQHRPQRPIMVFCDTHGNKRSAISTDQIALWGENAAQIASLSSVPPRGSAACGKLTLANQADSGKVQLGVMPLGRPFIECHEQGEQTRSWPPDSK